MTLAELYKAIKGLLLQNTISYGNSGIFVGQQNNLVMPDNYIIMTKLLEKDEILLPIQQYDGVNDLDISTTLIESTFQLDFYGATAEQDSGYMGAFFNTRFANNYFIENGYNCSVSNSETPVNLNGISGREQYINRYMLKLKLFHNRIVTVADDGIVTIKGETFCAEAL